MLGIPVEKVVDLIARVKAFDAKVEVVEPDPGSNPSDQDMREVLEDYSDDPALFELREFVESLNEEEQYNLVALAWLGRGTFDKTEWEEAVSEAKDARNDHTADYLLGMPLLGTYLEDGLDQLGYDRE